METKKTDPKTPCPRKVKLISIQCHQGVTLAPNGAGMVKNGINIKDGVDLELHPAGVLVIYQDPKAKGRGKLIPYANITQGDLEIEE